MKIFAPRCLVILKLFQNFLRRLSPDGYYEKEFHLMLFHGIRQKFHKFWPRNDPLTAITKLLYYEFEIDGYGNECRWIG